LAESDLSLLTADSYDGIDQIDQVFLLHLEQGDPNFLSPHFTFVVDHHKGCHESFLSRIEETDIP